MAGKEVKNEVKLVGNIVHVRSMGNQTADKVHETIKDTGQLFRELDKANKPRLVLIDLRNAGKTDIGSRKAGKEYLLQKYDKAAVFGASKLLTHIVKLIISAANNPKVKYFSSQEEAEKWLKA